jgi:hypothetical protein
MDKNNQAGVATIKICACNYLTGRFTQKKLDLSGEYYAKDARVISPDTNQIKLARNK